MDFKCSGDNLEQIPEEVVVVTGINFPTAHTDKDSMATLAKALMKHRKDVIARVPFCVTVEAEAYGGKIKLGDKKTGPRVESYLFSSVEEMSSLQGLDITKNRIKEVLGAVENLAGAGEKVALSVEGPFTIISSLIDPMNFYKGLRKHPELIKQILAVVEEDIISYSIEGIKRGAVIISYGDPVGAKDIVGPKVYREFSGPSSLRIIKGIKESGEKVIIHLCGKTSTALEDMDVVNVNRIEANEALTYGQALLELHNKLTEPIVVGHRCIKWSSKKMGQPVFWVIEVK